ncbi:MAG: autotransporter-associated beta strand repeat-containing protein [Verrucomicrobiaceae bacterium]|nr:autotransporter-associated beta strand repeat-containing protein [Verrucomicrobiaceae bacterium]
MLKTLRSHQSSIAKFLVALTAIWQVGQPLQAATIYWDGSTSGSWTGSSTNWNTLADGTGADVAVGTGNDLVFTTTAGATNFTQTVDGGVALAVNSILFNSSATSAITIAQGVASSTISLGAGGITLDSGTGAHTIGAPVTIAASQTWTNNSTSLFTVSGAVAGTNLLTIDGAGSTTITGIVSGAGGLTKNGTGTLTLTADPSATGALNINNGVLDLALSSTAATDMVTVNVNNTGTLRVSGGSGLGAATVMTLATGATYDTRIDDTIARLLGTGTVTNGGATARTLTLSDTTNATFGGVIQNGTAALGLAKSGTNTATLTGTSTYTGTTTVNTGVLEVSGATGAINGSTTVNIGDFINSTGVVDSMVLGQNADVVAGTLNRLADTAVVSLRGAATLTVNGPAATSGGVVETIGTLDANAGRGVLTLNPAAGQELQVTAGTLTRSNAGTLLVRGTGLGLAAGTADSSRLVFTTAPTGTNFVGGVGADGTTTMSIIPWMIGDTSITGAGSGFVTYGANGVRLLAAGEYDSTIAGTVTSRNVNSAGGETITVDSAINSLVISGGTTTITGPITSATLDSASLLFTGAATVTGNGRLNFGANQGLVTVSQNSAATAAIDAVVTGTAGLLVSSSGSANNIVQLGGENTLIGGIRVQNGAILQLKASSPGALNDNALNNITLDSAGTTLRLNGNSVAVGNLNTLAGGTTYSRAGIVENASATAATLTVNQNTAQNFEGIIQDGTGGGALSIIKAGTSTWTVQNNASTFTGSVEIRQGGITLNSNGSGGGRFTGVSTVILSSGGLLTLNHGSSNTADRIRNAASIQMRGGSLTLSGSGANNQSETVGALQIQSGSNTITSGQASSGNTQNVTFASWSRTSGSVVNFAGTGVGVDGRNRAVITAALTLNNLVLTGATVGNELAKYVTSGTISVAALAAGDYNTGAPTGWSDIVNAKPASAGTLAADTSVNGLVLNNVGLNLGGFRLNTDTGMIITTGAAGLISNGTLTAGNAGAGEVILKVDTGLTQDFNGGNVIIDDNGANPVALTVHGGGSLILNPANTHSGATSILGTTTSVSADGAFGDAPASATPGHLKLYAATLNVTDNMTLNANRGIELGGGANIISITAGTGTNGKTLTYNGSITSTGNSSLTLQSNATGTNTDGGEFVGTLTGTLNLGGNLRLDNGSITAPSATNVIGRNFQVGMNGTATYTQAGGTLKVGAGLANDTFDVGVSGADSVNKVGTLNLAGTSQFTANVDTVRIGVLTGGASVPQGTVTLATNNEISAITSFILGNSSGSGLGTQTLTFGSGTNSVTTPLMTLGGLKVPLATVSLPAGGTLALNGFRERQMDLYLARENISTSTAGLTNFTVDGTLTASLNSLQLGVKSGGLAGGATGNMTLSANAHNIEATTVTLGNIAGATSGVNAIGAGNLSMAGGTLRVVSDLSMGLHSGTAGTASGSLTLTGGTVTVGGNVVKTDTDRSSAIITLNGTGATLDLQDQAYGDSTAGTLTASQVNYQVGSLVDVASITLDGRGVTNGTTFASLDHALVIRDYTISVPLSLTGTTADKGGIYYENDNAGSGAVISGTTNFGTVQRNILVEDNTSVANDLTLSGALTAAGITKSGAGTLLLSNTSSTYTGNTAVQNGLMILAGGLNDRIGTTGTVTLGDGTTSGVLQLGDTSGASDQTLTGLSTSGTGTSNAIIGGAAANSTLTVNQSTNTVFSGNLGGVGTNDNNLTLIKGGTGTLELAGTNTLDGTVTVNAGALTVSNSGLLGPNVQSATVADGAALNFTSGSGTQVFAGTGSVLNLTQSSGTTILGFGVSGATNSQIDLGAGQTLTRNGTITTDIYVGSAPTLSSYVLIDSTGVGSFTGTGAFNIGTIINGGSFLYTLSGGANTDSQLILNVAAQAAPPDVWWLGDLGGTGTGVWSASAIGGNTNWATSFAGSTDAGVPPDSGSHVHFSATGAANFATTLGADMTVKQVTFESGTVTNGVSVGGTNNFTLAASGAGNIGLTVASGNAGTIQITAPVVLGQAQTWNVEDAAGILRISGGISGTGGLTLNGSGTATGSYLFDTASSTYTGSTALNTGRLTLEGTNRLPTTTELTLGSGTASAVLQLGNATSNANTTLAGLATSGTGTTNAIVNGNATASTLTINQTSNTQYDGVIGGVGTNENLIALVKQGAGTLVLNGANTYTGTTTVNQGTLQLGASGGITGSTGLNVIANAGTTAIFDVNGRSVTLAGAITLGGADSTAQPSIADTAGGGTITLGGSITYDATNNPLGGMIAADLIGTGASRTITGNDSSSAAIDLTISGDYVTTTNNSLSLDGTGTNLFSGNITSNSAAETTRDLNKAGSGTWTLSGAVNLGDNLNTNAGVLNISGTTTQNDLITTGAGSITNISGVVNGSATVDTANNGIYIRTGGVINILADNAVGSAIDFILVNDNAAGTSTFNVNSYTISTPRLDVGGASNTADRIGSVTGTGTINIGTVVNAYAGSVSPNLATASTGNVINKDSVGTVTLTGNNALGTSNSTIREGNLTLDFTTNAGTDNKIGTGSLNLGTTLGESSPVLTMIGHATTASEQSVSSLAVARGATQVVLDGNGAGLVLDVTGAITRTNAATVNFQIEAGTQVNAGTTTLTAENMIGAWATVNKSSFATISTGQIAAVTTVAGNDPHAWTAGQHVTNTGNFTNSVDFCAPDIASLTINAAAASTLTIDATRVLKITSGGLLVSPAVGANNTLISGGYLSSDLAGNALIVHQNNTAGTLELASTRVSGSLTKSGEGTLILSGTSVGTTGTVTLNEGGLVLTGGNAIGDGVDVQIQGATGSGATVLELAAGQTETFRQLLGGENSNGTVQLNVGSTLTINQTDGDTTPDENLVFGGNITGSGVLVKNGIDRLNLTGVSTHTGALIINQGGVHLNGALGSTTTTNITVNAGGTLLDYQDQTASIDRLSNSAVITLNNTNVGTTGPNQGFWMLTNQGATRTETITSIVLGAGSNVISANGNVTNAIADLSGSGTITRNNRATLLVRGNNLGASAGQRGQIRFATAPTGAVGGGGAAGSQNINIIPWIIGDLTYTNSGPVFGLGNTFVTNTGSTNGLRPLAAAEYTTDETAVNALTGASTDNVRFATNPTATLTTTATSINSLVLDNAAALTVTGPANSIAITSGAILAAGAGNHVLGGFTGITTGGSRDYTVYVTTAAANFTIDSPLTSAFPLVKSGAGSLTLTSASNAFTDLYLNQGTVIADANAKLGTGSIQFWGGGVRFAAGYTDDPSAKVWTVGTGGGTLDVSLVTNGVTLANGLKDSTPSLSDTLNIFTRSSATGSTGLLTIQGASTFTGTTVFRNAVVSLNGTATNSVVLNGTTNAALNGNVEIGDQTNVNNNNDVAVVLGNNDQIVDTATITFRGVSGENAYFKLLGFNETVAGVIDTTGQGVIENRETDTVSASGTLTLNSSNDYSYNGYFRDNSNGTADANPLHLTKQGTGTQTLSGANIRHSGTTTISGGTLSLADVTNWQSAITNNATLNLNQTAARTHAQVISGTGTLVKTGTGTLTLSGTNTYSGATTIQNGSLSISSSANLGDASATNDVFIGHNTTLISTGATVDLTANRTVTVEGSGTIDVTGTNTLTAPGVLSGDACAILNKAGTGLLTLNHIANATSFLGATNVSAGTLQVGSGGTAGSSGTGDSGSGDVTVASGATLAGSGTVQGSTILGAGSVLQAGDVTTVGTAVTTVTNNATLTFTEAVTASAGSATRLGITSSTNVTPDPLFGGNDVGTLGYTAYVIANGSGVGDHDRLVLNDGITLAGTVSVLPGTFTPIAGQIFNLLDWTGLTDFSAFSVGTNYRDGSGDNSDPFNLPDISSSGLVWDVSLFTTNGIIVVVPEPSRALLLLLGLLGLLMRRRR